jgi:GH24 family phage-related lysozyme (muramidase)
MAANPFAEVLNQLLGRPLAAGEQQALECELEKRDQNPVPGVPGSLIQPTSVSPVGVALIQQFEDCARRRPDGRYEAYPDPGTGGAPWTIGWGATGADGFATDPGARIGPGTVWTGAQCNARLEADLARYAADVTRSIGEVPTSQRQFDALTSFHYNTGAIARASLTRKHVAGDHAGAAREFARWVRAGGKVLPGLVRRREAEAALYRS